jgi:hypothetical protein
VRAAERAFSWVAEHRPLSLRCWPTSTLSWYAALRPTPTRPARCGASRSPSAPDEPSRAGRRFGPPPPGRPGVQLRDLLSWMVESVARSHRSDVAAAMGTTQFECLAPLQRRQRPHRRLLVRAPPHGERVYSWSNPTLTVSPWFEASCGPTTTTDSRRQHHTDGTGRLGWTTSPVRRQATSTRSCCATCSVYAQAQLKAAYGRAGTHAPSAPPRAWSTLCLARPIFTVPSGAASTPRVSYHRANTQVGQLVELEVLTQYGRRTTVGDHSTGGCSRDAASRLSATRYQTPAVLRAVTTRRLVSIHHRPPDPAVRRHWISPRVAAS